MLASELDKFLVTLKTGEDWKQFYELVKVRYNTFLIKQGDNFNIGDRVTFFSSKARYYGNHTGTITKIKLKMASVKVDNGVTWNVGFSILKKVQ